MIKREYFNQAMIAVIALVYGQSSFAEGGLLPKFKESDGLGDGSKSLMEVISNFVKPGLLLMLGVVSIVLLVKSINTAVTGLKKAQEEDGSIATMLTYVVTAAIASVFGLMLAYLAFQIYSNVGGSNG